MTTTTDQNGGQWPKTFDAMGRNVTTVTPTVSSTNYTNTKFYDGNGNIVKVTDFKSQNTEYTYNARGQRTRIRYKGMGSGGSDVDVDFDWNCCRITAYDDPLGTSASMSYDEFARLTSHTDQQGNALAYEYDGMNRVTKVTDHTSTDTDYEYDPAGRLKQLTYDPGGAGRVTAYGYDENGNVTLATYSNGYTSAYAYDDINRVTQHVLKDSAGPPNTLEQYDYDYSPGGLPSNTYGYERAETTTGDTYLIAFDRLSRIKQEKMTDSGSNLRYQFDHTYDSAGNRTNLEISGNLQNPRNFGYTFNAMGHLTAVSENTNLNNYAAAVTNDANGNITQVTETWNGQFPLASTLAYDYENRLTQHATGMLGITVAHKYDGLGRLVRTDRTTQGPTTTQFEHVRDGLKLVGNIDATNTNTAPTWTNKPGALRPVESQQVVTNSATQYINVADEISPARRTYNPSTSAAGDTEAIAAKGKLVLVNGATPALTASLAVNPSELFSQRNMTYNENSIALPSDRGTLEISGANLMYEGARVKSWMMGRDVNPAGRGDGAYYAQGAFSIGSVRPSPTTTPVGGWGNSVNNDIPFGEVDAKIDCAKIISQYWNDWEDFCRSAIKDYESKLADCRSAVEELKKKAQEIKESAERKKQSGLEYCDRIRRDMLKGAFGSYAICWTFCLFVCAINPPGCAACLLGCVIVLAATLAYIAAWYAICRRNVINEYKKSLKEAEDIEKNQIPAQRRACCKLYEELVADVQFESDKAIYAAGLVARLCPKFKVPNRADLVKRCNLPGAPPECSGKDG